MKFNNYMEQECESFANRNVVLGVSLGNKVFKKEFVERLFHFLVFKNPRSVTIFLGDCIEVSNYIVFKGTNRREAKSIAHGRGISLGRMFEKKAYILKEAGIGFRWDLESELKCSNMYGEKIKYFKEIFDTLYNTDDVFRGDVWKQILKNLSMRINSENKDYIYSKEPILKDYILGELVVFMSIFSILPRVSEIYPGDNLFVKENVLKGKYSIPILFDSNLSYNFCNVSFLLDSPGDILVKDIRSNFKV